MKADTGSHVRISSWQLAAMSVVTDAEMLTDAIGSCVRAGHGVLAVGLLEEIERRGLEPPPRAFQFAAQACAGQGPLLARLVEQMAARGKHSRDVYSATISAAGLLISGTYRLDGEGGFL